MKAAYPTSLSPTAKSPSPAALERNHDYSNRYAHGYSGVLQPVTTQTNSSPFCRTAACPVTPSTKPPKPVGRIPSCAWNFERKSRMKHKILETKNQVKLQLYEAYLTRQAIPHKKRYTPMSGGYCLYVDKANLSRIDGKEALGDLYGSVEKSYFGITDCPNEKK